MDAQQLLTLAEVSDYLGLPEETIYKYARNGRIPASKIGRFWRFNRGDVDNWVAKHSNRGSSSLSILVVDDEELVRSLLVRWLTDMGCDVHTASNGMEALQKVADNKLNVVFLDLMMPGMNGVETLAEIRERDKDMDVVILTSFFDSPMMEKALAYGPLTLVRKPIEKETLQRLVAAYFALTPDQSS